MSLPKTASCTDTRSSFALFRFDTVPFCCARWLSWCLNPTPMVALPNSKWTLAHCSARSGHFAQLEVAQLVNATRSGHLLATSSNGHLLKCHLPTWTGHLPRRGRRPRATTDSPPTLILESSSSSFPSTPHLGQLLAFGPSSWLKPKLCLIGMSCVNPRQRGPDDNTPPSTLPEVHCRLNAK